MANFNPPACLSIWSRNGLFLIASLLFLSLGVTADANPDLQDGTIQQAQAEVKQAEADKKKDEKDKDAEPSEDDHESNYFGISTVGKEIIYVVDNSNSMNGGRFNAAAQAVTEVTPGMISVSNAAESRANKYMKEP